MKVTAKQLNTLLEWVIRRNDDGLPNEVRACYTDDEWIDIMETYRVGEEIPTSSSHMYQCEACCTEFESLLPVLDYWNSSEGRAHTAKRKKEISQWIETLR
jgi:hypothetical protein